MAPGSKGDGHEEVTLGEVQRAQEKKKVGMIGLHAGCPLYA